MTGTERTLPADPQLTRWLVKIEIVSKYEIDLLAANKDEAITQAIEMTTDESPVDSYTSEAHAKEVK